MIPVSPELAEAIEAPERHPLVKLLIDWDAGESGVPEDLSHMVESVSIDRTMAGDLPDEVSLVEGSAAASMEVTLVNPDPDGMPAGKMFNRFNTASPLFGKEFLSAPLSLDIGFQTSAGPEHVRRFTGLSRAVKAGSASRSVKLAALDFRERLAWEWDIPQVGRETFGLNASWALAGVIDSRAWLSGYRVSPGYPDGVSGGLSIPMYGSLHLPGGIRPGYTARVISSLGYPSTTTGASWWDRTTEPRFIPGRFLVGCYAGPSAVGRFRANAQRGEFTYDTSPSYSDYIAGRLEFWTMRRPALFGESATAWKTAFVFSDDGGTFGIMAGINAAGQLVIGSHTGNPNTPASVTGATVPADGQWHYVGLQWKRLPAAGTYELTFRLDGAAPVVTTAAGWPDVTILPVQVVKGYWRQPISDVLFQPRWDMNNPGWTWELRDTANVKMDYSTLELDVIPETSRRPVWEWMRRIGAAEQAVVFLDEYGVLHYRTVKRLAEPSAQIPVRVLTSQGSLLDLSLDDSVDAVRNSIITTVHPVSVSDTMAPVYSSRDVWSIPARSTGGLAIEFDRPAMNIDFTVTLNRPGDGAPDPATTFVCVAFTSNGASTGDPIVESQYGWLHTELSYFDERTYSLSIRNDSDREVWIVTSKTDTANVSVAGRAATIGSQDVYSFLKFGVGDPGGIPAIIRRHGEQRLKLPDNPWLQRIPPAVSLVQRIVWEIYRPQPVVRDLEIIGDPRLQLGDRVRIEDRDGLALTGEYWISGIRETWSRTSGYRQRITARRANTTLRWGQSKWAQSTWGEV